MWNIFASSIQTLHQYLFFCLLSDFPPRATVNRGSLGWGQNFSWDYNQKLLCSWMSPASSMILTYCDYIVQFHSCRWGGLANHLQNWVWWSPPPLGSMWLQIWAWRPLPPLASVWLQIWVWWSLCHKAVCDCRTVGASEVKAKSSPR